MLGNLLFKCHCMSVTAFCTVPGLFLYIRAKLLSMKVKTICFSALLMTTKIVHLYCATTKNQICDFCHITREIVPTEDLVAVKLDSHTYFSEARSRQLPVEAPICPCSAHVSEKRKFSTSDRIAPQHCVNTAERGEGLTLHVYGCEALALQSSP